MKPVDVTLPIRLISEANVREHHMLRARRAAKQRLATKFALFSLLAPYRSADVRTPIAVAITRIGPRRLDGDNLQRACKAVRDGIADALGIDDGDERLTFHYGQAGWAQKGVRPFYGVRVIVSRAEAT